MEEYTHENEVLLTGTVLEPPEYSHSNHAERFVRFPLQVLRLSGQTDELAVLAPERLLRRMTVEAGGRISVEAVSYTHLVCAALVAVRGQRGDDRRSGIL